MTDDNKRKLYDALSQDYDMGTFEQFSTDVEDERKRRKLYDAIKEEYDLPDFDGFTRQLGVGAAPQQPKEQSNTPTSGGETIYQVSNANAPHYDFGGTLPSASGGTTATQKPQQVRQTQPKKEQPTGPKAFAERMQKEQQMRNRLAMAGLPSPEAMQESFTQRMENMRKGNQPFSSGKGVQYNPETGKMEDVYYTKGGDVVSTSMEQAQENRMLDENLRTRDEVEHLSERIDAGLEQAKERATEKLMNSDEVKTLTDKDKNFFQKIGAAISFNNAPVTTAKLNTPEVQEYKAAQRMMRDAKRVIAEADHNAQSGTFGKWLEQSFAGGAMRGLGQRITDIDTWDFGMSDLLDNMSIMEALNKADKGEPLTESQQALLDAMAVQMSVNTYFGSEVGRGYKAGTITAESVPFMLEMVLNPASGIGTSVEAKLTRYAIKRFGKAAVKKGGQKYIRRKGMEIGGRLLGDVLGAATMTATTGTVRTQADAFKRMNDATMQGKELSYGEAFAEAFANTTIQNYSEMFGEYFAPLKEWVGGGLTRLATSKFGSKVGLDRVHDFINTVSMSDVARVVTDFEKHAKWNGVFGEYAEEVAGNVMNAIVVGDQTLDADPETGVFNLDQNIDTFLGVSLLGGFMSTVKTAGYRTPKYQARRAMNEADQAAMTAWGIDNEAWLGIRDVIANGTVGEVKSMLNDIATNPDYSEEQKRAALQYAQKATAYKGVMNGDMKRRESGEVSEEELAVEDAFDNGYEATEPQEVQDIAIEKADETAGSHSPEEREAAWEGVRQRIEDDADDYVHELKMADIPKQHLSDGSIRYATLKEQDDEGNDKMVYIVSGEVVMTADGTMVDRDRTLEANGGSTSIVIYDPSTGEKRMIDPMSDTGILSVGQVESAEQRNELYSQMREDFVKHRLDEAQNRVSVEQGQTITTPDGQTGQVIATSPDGEQFTVAFEDGEQVQMERGELQQVADEVARADYEQRHAEESDDRNVTSQIVEGAPEDYTPGLKISIVDEAGQEQQGEVVGRVRYEKGKFVPDENGGIVEYVVDGKTKHENIGKLNDMVSGYEVEQEPTEEVALPTQETGQGNEDSTLKEEAAKRTETEPQPVSVDAMPMREDGEADFLATTPERGHQFIYNEAGLSREEAGQFVKANLETATKALDKAKKEAPKMGTSLVKYKQQQAEHQAKVDAAQQAVDYWQGVKATQSAIVSAEMAEQAERDRIAHEAAVLEEAARQAEELAKREEQAVLGSNAVAPQIVEKWQSVPKVEGVENEITLANGETVKGRYMLVESGAATPSHNPNMEFTRNEGFPIDENGQTVNDRDYERDQEAQRITRQMANNYDSRAIQSVPVVSPDGIVLSGNGRTMAGELAAKQGTDGAYIEHLKKYPQQFGFTVEQVDDMLHPRVVFVADEAMPYTTETFAKFNQQDMKSQSRTEQSVKMGKTVDDNTFGRIIHSINGFDSLADFYNDPVAATNAIGELHSAGAINTMQLAEMMDGEKVSGNGRQMLENMLIGKAFESNPDAIRQLAEFPAMRQSIVSALAEIANNIHLGEEYSLESELAQAINLAYQARKNGVRAGDKVSWFARQQSLFPFDTGETVADYTNATVLMLADELNSASVNGLKKCLALYNHHAAEAAAGQYDIFSGGIKNKQDIINDALNVLNYGTEQEQQAALAAAVEQRKQGVHQDGLAGAGETGDAGATAGQSDLAQTEINTPLLDESVKVASAIASAESEVDTNPTDGQKEAGNYKKGHLKLDGYDITIEQPKGSIRRGTDDNGKQWEQEMHNTYGYIRGTEGVDGDHIDVFLSDDPTGGDVFVVDQVNPKTGEFDEHKVMYGFPDMESAKAAYISNYEDGWQGLGAITPVSKEEFKKWIESSHRKTKPFSEYVSVKALGDTELPNMTAEQQAIGDAMVYQLESMGLEVSTDISENRRVHKEAEKDNSEAGKLRHYKTTEGKVYGFSYKGKMYLDPRRINADLPLHEYAHLWCEALGKLNPEGWKGVVDLMKGDAETWNLVKQLIPDLTDENDIAAEMIARYSSRNGAERAKAEYERMNAGGNFGNIWQNIAKAIQDFWRQVGDFLNIKYKSAEQVYDQVVKDFANKINPRRRVEEWLAERDEAYMQAVENGDTAKAKEIFDDALRENVGNGITPFIAVDGYRGKMDRLARGVKSRDPKVIAEVADLMSPLVPTDAVLVPAPSHSGEATDMLDVANAIAERTGAPVADVLKSEARESQHEAKRENGQPIMAAQMGITMNGELPDGKLPVVIDNVVDSGNTAEACVQALGKGVVVSLAEAVDRYDHVVSLKSAAPVVHDKSGAVVPLSKRFELGGSRYLDKAHANDEAPLSLSDMAKASDEIASVMQHTEQPKEETADQLFDSIKRGDIFVNDNGLTATIMNISRKNRGLGLKWEKHVENGQNGQGIEVFDPVKLKKWLDDNNMRKQGEPKAKSKWVDDEDAERFEALRRRMRELNGHLNMGVNPEQLAIGVEMSYYVIKHGAHKFADYAKQMIDALGEWVRPYLKSFYNGARDLPEMEAIGNELTTYDEVKAFDVLNFDKEGPKDIIAMADHVVKEREAERQAEEASVKLKKQRKSKSAAAPSGQMSLFGEDNAPESEVTKQPTEKKPVKNNNNENTDIQPRSGEEGRGGHEPQPNGALGEGAGNETARPDGGRVGGRDKAHSGTDGEGSERVPGLPVGEQRIEAPQSSKERYKKEALDILSKGDNFYGETVYGAPTTFSALYYTMADTIHLSDGMAGGGMDLSPKDFVNAVKKGVLKQQKPEVKHNLNNNHAERGTDYAPKDVDKRIAANIAAIEKMQELMESGKQATPEDMEVLRKFSGWGGLGKAFQEKGYGYGYDPTATSKRLKELLGDEGYEQANMSRNSAYYTPAKIIDTLWDIAKAMGFKGGKVLEGSAGIGNIIGLMPQEMSERSDIHAVEIDSTTGNILKLLYPDAKVEVQGFEATQVENGSIDLAITNVPFVTGLRVNDTTGDKDLSKKFKDIHDFCIAKNVRKLREGGIGIFITSSGTLDNSAKLREWIVQEGASDVVGAFRMNNETFGGTGATSDIIVVRKRVNGKKSVHAIDVLSTTGERSVEYDTGETKKVKGEYVPVVKQLSMDYNKYFVEHPEMMGGEMAFAFEHGDTYRATSKGLYPKKGIDQGERLAAFVKSMEGKVEDVAITSQQTEQQEVYADLGEGVKEGSLVINDGKLCIAQRGKAVPLDVNVNKVKGHTKEECFNAYSDIKEALAAVLEYQTENEGDEGLQPLLEALNAAYDKFVATYGHLHKNTSISFLKNDVDFANIIALEKFSERGDVKTGKRIQEYGKTDIFRQRVVEKEKAPEPTNVKDGIIASIYVHGRIDVPWIVEQLDKVGEKDTALATQHTEQSVKEEIIKSGLGFENPSTRQMEVSYEYLSGNVREKLAHAQQNNADGRYDTNIKALESVIPMNIPAHLIDFSIGSSWIDPKLYEDYVKERTDVEVTLTLAGGTWYMRKPGWLGEQKNRSFGIVSQMLGKTIMGTDLIEAAMQNKTITVSETRRKYDGSTETVTDKDATTACANKIDEIRQDFKDWARGRMQSDAAMSEHIEKVYNEMFNNYVPKSIPDDFVPEHFGGAATMVDGKPFALRPHQGKAVVRGTTQPLLLAHEVGTGKTYTLITTAMEMRRLGTARKPMIVVQNSTVGQFVESAKKLYPNAKVLTIEDKDHTAEGRKNFYAKIKYNDWDMIVVPQSVFERIPDSEERQMAFVQDKIEEKELVLEQMKDADPDGNSLIVRQAEKEIEKLNEEMGVLTGFISDKRKEKDAKKAAVAKQNAEVKALEMLDRQTDDVENFDDMGIDAILVDEAHEYKHLGFATAMQRGVKGVDPSYSKKAQGVFLKTQAVLEKNNGRNVVFATGTPISNTAAEIWTFMRYLMPSDTLKDYGIYYFDDFVRNFGNLTQMLEFTTSGKFKENNRFAGYVNLPELVRIWSGVADTVLTNEAGGVSDKIPDMEGGKAQDIYLPQTKALRSVMKHVKSELDRYDKMTGKEKKENSHIPLTMYGIAKAAAVDARLVVSNATDDPQSKTNEAVRQTLRSLEDTKSYNGTVALFADNYQNRHSGFNLYEDIREKLIEAGVPEEQIVVMKSGMSVKKKLEIFDRVNRGEVRVIMGSTFTLGTGVNIQERLHTLIHLDAPNRPMDYTQRNGRILRQGNLHKDMDRPVRVLRFGVEDSLDVTAYQRLKTKGAIADSIMNGKQMMSNSMENRVLEEEEDVFGDTVAQLSGSEYAMLKNQAEKDVRKYENKKKQWEADQTYCHNEIPRLESKIRNSRNRLESVKAALEKVEKANSQNEANGLVIEAGKKKYDSLESMADFIKDYNKKIREIDSDMRENPYKESEKKLSLKVTIGGFDFVFTTEMTVDTQAKQGTLFTAVRRNMTYTCEELGLEDMPVKQSLLREGLEDIVDNVITGKDFRERIDNLERGIEKNESALAQVKERDGKPFGFSKELEAAHKHYDEYSELMKKEMEEKEKKYAAMDSDVEEASEITNAEEAEEEEDDGVRFRDGESGENLLYRFRKDEEPTNTGIGYKVFVLKDGELYPPMVANPNGEATPVGVWLDADAAPIAGESKTGRPQVKAGGKGTQGGSGQLAYRPGWHLGTIPYALQFNRKNPDTGEKELFPANFVWAEVEYANDVDYQEEANAEGMNANGKYQHSLAGLKRVPVNGSYMYRTNPDPATDPWIITGAMKVKRILKPSEVDEIVRVAGREPQKRQEGAITDEQIEALNNELALNMREGEGNQTVEVSYEESLASSRAAGYSKKQHDAMIARRWKQRVASTQEYAKRLGLEGRVNVVLSADEVEGISERKKRAKGWFDPKTGKIVVVLYNHTSMEDVIETLQHEGVAHYGLRAMYGKHFDEFLDAVFANSEESIRKEIVKMSESHGWNIHTGTEEYLAKLAEDTDFEKPERQTWWSMVKQYFHAMLQKLLGRPRFAEKAVEVELSDNELRYILWCSYENLREPGRYVHWDYIQQARDVAMQSKLKVGEYKEDTNAGRKEGLIPMAAEQNEPTPVAELKNKYPGVAMLNRVGDHFEVYGEDAKAVSAATGLPIYEDGIVRFSQDEINDVLPKLVRRGQRVAIMEPMEARKESDDGSLLRDGDFSERDEVMARDYYERMVSQSGYQFREAMQDSMLGLRKAYEAILGKNHADRNRSSFRIEEVPGNENAYLAENRMSSANAAEQHNYFQQYMQPLLKAIHKICGSDKWLREELTDYMMAKHGLERNEKFAQRDFAAYQQQNPTGGKSFADFRERDYAGLTALTGMDDVHDAELAAQQIVADFESQHDVSKLWAATKRATGVTLAKIYRSGLLSKESYEQIRDMFEWYIPLQGFDETTSDEVYGYLTSRQGPMGSPIKHAKGRSSKADDPIATIGLMADMAIRQANRNEMKKLFLNFVQNHPSDLVSVSRLWLQHDDVTDEWVPVFTDIEESDTAADVERKVTAFEQRMEQLAQAEPDKYKRGSDAKNLPYRVLPGNISEHQVLVKRNGETFVLTINGNPRAAQALNGLTNPDVKTGGFIGGAMKLAQWMNHQMSAAYTTRTPDFVVSNFFRDMLYSNCMTWVKEGGNYALKFHKNFGKMNPVTMRKLFGKWEKGTLDDSKPTEYMFKQFMMNGGETGYTNVRDIEAHKREIVKELKRQGSVTRKVWHALGMQLDLLNRSVENCARFAAFITSQEMGRSIERSIYDAKEVSVNFNKKGSGDKMIGAVGQTNWGKIGSFISGGGRLLYVFWNAGTQGMTNFMRAAKRNPGKFSAGAAVMFTLGAVIPLLAKALAGDGDDDDKNAYYNLPEYVRRSNICFRVGDAWITIPLPIEFRAIYGLGELGTGVITGEEHYSDGELARQLTSQVSQILPLDFMEGGGGLHAFIPSQAKPIVEAASNKSWTGLPIYKDTPFNQSDPEFTKVYKNADSHIVGASKWLNELTGGDDYKKGWADVVNPAQVEYVLNGYFGGWFKVPTQLMKMGETAWGDREFEWRNMMLANRLVKNGDERTANRKLLNEYFELKKEYEETKRLLKKYEKAKDEGALKYAEKLDFLNNSEEYARYEIFDEYRKEIDNLWKDMKEQEGEERKATEAEYYSVMREMVNKVHAYERGKK